MVYTVFYKTSSFAGYCFLDKNSIHPKRYGVFSFKAFIAVLVKIQICSFIVIIKCHIRISLFHNQFYLFRRFKNIQLILCNLLQNLKSFCLISALTDHLRIMSFQVG